MEAQATPLLRHLQEGPRDAAGSRVVSEGCGLEQSTFWARLARQIIPDDGLEVVVVILIHQEAVEDGEARALYWGGEMA